MATTEEQQSVWQGFKGFLSDRFKILDSYHPYIRRDTPLPSWSDADVHEFIASDPVHGPVLKTTRDAVKFLAAGGIVGALSTAGFAWKYSKSPWCCIVVGSRSSIWDEFWSRSCKSYTSTTQVRHHGCPGQVHGMVAEEI